jgi:hypothetical protein
MSTGTVPESAAAEQRSPTTTSVLPFTPEEVAEFRRGDKRMAVVIFCVLNAILTIGLLLYTGIALWVYGG